ncbi:MULTISPECIES: hypothetical protein [unclassified Streptomyces]|uniref:hypothetical protein n=1 Tax=unclassified Streptomyces TaxID=2593676 RepID=UPI002E3429B9|nr:MULTISPECIES: hypothetical protein [unclassified Streptomyces]
MPMVEGYVRADGTKVRRYFRLPAGARKETGLLFMIVVGVWLFGSGPVTAGGESDPNRLPQPQATVVYPIKWPGWDKPVVAPTPTVSYPIVFPSPASGQ